MAGEARITRSSVLSLPAAPVPRYTVCRWRTRVRRGRQETHRKRCPLWRRGWWCEERGRHQGALARRLPPSHTESELDAAPALRSRLGSWRARAATGSVRRAHTAPVPAGAAHPAPPTFIPALCVVRVSARTLPASHVHAAGAPHPHSARLPCCLSIWLSRAIGSTRAPPHVQHTSTQCARFFRDQPLGGPWWGKGKDAGGRVWEGGVQARCRPNAGAGYMSC